MKNQQPLIYFDYLLFIDPNQNIFNEISYFAQAYDEKLRYFSSVQQSKQYLNENLSEKMLIICSSRLIQQINTKILNKYSNCYHKVIVFCGSLARCDQVMQQYPTIAYTAQCYENKVMQKIEQIEKKLTIIKNKSTFQIIWVIKQEKQKEYILKQFASSLHNIVFLLGINVVFRVYGTQLETQISFMQEMESNVLILMVLDNRDGRFNASLAKFNQFQDKYSNIFNFYVLPDIKSTNKQEHKLVCSEVNSAKQIYTMIHDVVDWDLDPTL